jgi:hypothetical protein
VIFLKLLIISVIILILAMVFLGVRILIKKNGIFPETHAGHNREMQKRGITCSRNTDTGCTPVGHSAVCSSCGKKITL